MKGFRYYVISLSPFSGLACRYGSLATKRRCKLQHVSAHGKNYHDPYPLIFFLPSISPLTILVEYPNKGLEVAISLRVIWPSVRERALTLSQAKKKIMTKN